VNSPITYIFIHIVEETDFLQTHGIHSTTIVFFFPNQSGEIIAGRISRGDNHPSPVAITNSGMDLTENKVDS
jgi:hypothetical protein